MSYTLILHLQCFISPLKGTPSASQLLATPVPPRSDQVDDLFSAHNFDIQIDLPSGGDGVFVAISHSLNYRNFKIPVNYVDSSVPKVMPKVGGTAKQEGPRRSLNLSDYKKRRGLI